MAISRPAALCLPLLFLTTVPDPAPAPTAPPGASAAWLDLLPEGERKRQFILDCTGCHQFDERIATVDGRSRSAAEWSSAIRMMLGFAGPTSGFPVISGHQDAGRTAAWLVEALGERRPAAATRPSASGRVEEVPFPVAEDLPHDLAIAPGGEVVVTGMFSHAMHVYDPSNRAWSRTEIPVPAANPRAVEIDAAGHWWVVLGNPRMVARYDGLAWQAHPVGVYAHSVALDGAGGAWVNGHFTRAPELLVHVGAAGTDSVVLPPHPELAGVPGGPMPYELRTGPDGRIWMSELQGNRIVVHDPRSGGSKAWTMPTTASGPRRLDVGRDGIVWIPAYAAGLLVRFDPRTERFTEIPLPVADALPYVVREDPRTGHLWIGTAAADALLRYDPSGGTFDVIPLPSAGALVRHLAVDGATGAVWMAYGESPGKGPAKIAVYRP